MNDSAPMSNEASTADSWDWRFLLDAALKHRRKLIFANLISVCATLLSVPIPLLMPLLVDEVLLDNPGTMVETINGLFPTHWQSPWLYILAALALSLVLRLGTMLFNVLQSRQFTLIAKDITYRLRHRLLSHLGRVSMAEYESLGSGAVSSHLVTDINVIDTFIGATVSRFLVSVLTLIGVSIVLFWMQWQLALFIMLLNPVVGFFYIRMGANR
jgi:ATP-binding cassette subfamily C protein